MLDNNKMPNPNSNKLADLAKMLDAIRHRQRPGLCRASYLKLDKYCQQLLERLKQHHPDYYAFRLTTERDPLPTPDSVSRFTSKPKFHHQGGGTGKHRSPRGFTKPSQALLDDILEGRPNRSVTKFGMVCFSAQIPVSLFKSIALQAKARNVSCGQVLREILEAQPVAQPGHINHC